MPSATIQDFPEFQAPPLTRLAALARQIGGPRSGATLYPARTTTSVLDALKSGRFISMLEIWALLDDPFVWTEPTLAQETARLLWKAGADARVRTLLGWRVAAGRAPRELVLSAPKEGALGEYLTDDALGFAGRCLLLDRTPAQWFRKSGLPTRIPFVLRAGIEAPHAFAKAARNDRQGWLLRCMVELRNTSEEAFDQALDVLFGLLGGEGIIDFSELRRSILELLSGYPVNPRIARRIFEWQGVEQFASIEQIFKDIAVPNRIIFWSNYAARLRSNLVFTETPEGYQPWVSGTTPDLAMLDFTHLIMVEDFQKNQIGLVTSLDIAQLAPPIPKATLQGIVTTWFPLSPEWPAGLYQHLRTHYGIEPNEGIKRFRGCPTDPRTGMPTGGRG